MQTLAVEQADSQYRRTPTIVARPGFEKQLAERTLTKLFNQRPAWLAAAHAALDHAVAAAYGWPEDPATLADDEVLRRLLALNRERVAG